MARKHRNLYPQVYAWENLLLAFRKADERLLSMLPKPEVTRIAPDLALGYFNLGLAKFYPDYLDDAKIAFDRAVALNSGDTILIAQKCRIWRLSPSYSP